MKTECSCRDGERCNLDEDGTLCPLMQATQDYWLKQWNAASPTERMTQMQADAELIDAGRGHLVAS